MSKFGLSHVFGAMLGASALVSCGVDDSPVGQPEMVGDDAPADDDAPAGGAPAMPEPTVMIPMTDPETLPEGAYECSYDRVPNEKITDFSIWNEGGDTVWGDDMSLTGGVFSYQNEGSDPLTVEVDMAAGTAHITGTVNGYAGWGLWFGPCTNAYRWTGIQFTMGGSLGETGQLEFQVQQNNNYPIDTSAGKGACAGDWSDGCASNKYVHETEFPAEPAPIQVPFADMTAGEPNPIEPAELLGIQWQFNCMEGETCELDVIIDDVTFYGEMAE